MTNQERVTQITMLAEQLRLSEEMAQSVLNDINRQMAERQAVIEGLEQKVVALKQRIADEDYHTSCDERIAALEAALTQIADHRTEPPWAECARIAREALK